MIERDSLKDILLDKFECRWSRTMSSLLGASPQSLKPDHRHHPGFVLRIAFWPPERSAIHTIRIMLLEGGGPDNVQTTASPGAAES